MRVKAARGRGDPPGRPYRDENRPVPRCLQVGCTEADGEALLKENHVTEPQVGQGRACQSGAGELARAEQSDEGEGLSACEPGPS